MERYLVRQPEELREILAEKGRLAVVELELVRDGAEVVIAAIDGDKATLAARPPGRKTFFTAANPTYTGPVDARTRLCLANGQVDSVSANWIVSREDAFRTIEHLFTAGELPEWLSWL